MSVVAQAVARGYDVAQVVVPGALWAGRVLAQFVGLVDNTAERFARAVDFVVRP
jgi:hypothetical protein